MLKRIRCLYLIDVYKSFISSKQSYKIEGKIKSDKQNLLIADLPYKNTKGSSLGWKEVVPDGNWDLHEELKSIDKDNYLSNY